MSSEKQGSHHGPSKVAMFHQWLQARNEWSLYMQKYFHKENTGTDLGSWKPLSRTINILVCFFICVSILKAQCLTYIVDLLTFNSQLTPRTHICMKFTQIHIFSLPGTPQPAYSETKPHIGTMLAGLLNGKITNKTHKHVGSMVLTTAEEDFVSSSRKRPEPRWPQPGPSVWAAAAWCSALNWQSVLSAGYVVTKEV